MVKSASEFEKYVERARTIESYFEDIYSLDGRDSWALGLYIAKRWRALLQSGDKEEIALLMKVLDAERPNQGSGWTDLRWEVHGWVEAHQEN